MKENKGVLFAKALDIVNGQPTQIDSTIIEDVAKVQLKGLRGALNKAKISDGNTEPPINNLKDHKDYFDGFILGSSIMGNTFCVPTPSSLEDIFDRVEGVNGKKEYTNPYYTGYILSLSKDLRTIYKKIMIDPDTQTFYSAIFEMGDDVPNVEGKLTREEIINDYKKLGYNVSIRLQKEEPLLPLEVGDKIIYDGGELLVIDCNCGYNTLYIGGDCDDMLYSLDLPENVDSLDEILSYYRDVKYQIIKCNNKNKGSDEQ